MEEASHSLPPYLLALEGEDKGEGKRNYCSNLYPYRHDEESVYSEDVQDKSGEERIDLLCLSFVSLCLTFV